MSPNNPKYHRSSHHRRSSFREGRGAAASTATAAATATSKDERDADRSGQNYATASNNRTNSSSSHFWQRSIRTRQAQQQQQHQREQQQLKPMAAAAASGNKSNHSGRFRSTRAAATSTASTTTTTRTTIADFIPYYLRQWVFPYHGDFCYTPMHHPQLLAQLMMEGFLPIANADVVLPKLHVERSVIPLARLGPNQLLMNQNQNQQLLNQNQQQPCLHVPKSVRKKAKRWTMTLNTAFAQVVEGCRQQHGDHCWLYPELVKAFALLHAATTRTMSSVSDSGNDSIDHDVNSSDCNTGIITHIFDPISGQPTGQTCRVRLYSIEVWQIGVDSNESHSGHHNQDSIVNADSPSDTAGTILVAGELGYSVGSMYTSLTGFTRQDSAGSVQLAALGRLLQKCRFVWWDLGMDMSYKVALGADIMPRPEFVRAVHEARVQDHIVLQLPVSVGMGCNCRDVIDSCYSPNSMTAASVPPSLLTNNLSQSQTYANKKIKIQSSTF